jgi:hypothetical protein
MLSTANPIRIQEKKPELLATLSFHQDVAIRKIAMKDSAFRTSSEIVRQVPEERSQLLMGKISEQPSNLLDVWDVFCDKITLLQKKGRPALEIRHGKRSQKASFNQCTASPPGLLCFGRKNNALPLVYALYPEFFDDKFCGPPILGRKCNNTHPVSRFFQDAGLIEQRVAIF